MSVSINKDKLPEDLQSILPLSKITENYYQRKLSEYTRIQTQETKIPYSIIIYPTIKKNVTKHKVSIIYLILLSKSTIESLDSNTFSKLSAIVLSFLTSIKRGCDKEYVSFVFDVVKSLAFTVIIFPS